MLPSDLVLSKEQRLVNEFPLLNDNGDEYSGDDVNGRCHLSINVHYILLIYVIISSFHIHA